LKNNSQTLIHHFLETSADLYPDKVALVHDDVRATYAQINNQANHLAQYFIGQGITHGDRVVFILQNSLEYVVTYYGILKAGAVAVPLSTEIKSDGLYPLLKELEPKTIVSSFRYERLLETTDLKTLAVQSLILSRPRLARGSVACSVIPLEDLVNKDPVPNLDLPIPESNLAGIIYTSGSTGEPRGVMLSHRNIVSNTHAICQYLQLTNEDIQMVVLPFFYVMGKSLLNTHFAVGGTVVLNNKFAFPASVLNQMVEEKVTGFSGVPSTFAYLLHRSPLASYRDRLKFLRYCSQAGGHMSRAIKEQLRKVLPDHTKIYVMYGATEASARLTYLEPDRFAEKMDSVGKPIPGVSIRILDEDAQELPRGETGEIVAGGPNIMLGYWKNAQMTARSLDHNGYHTGDLGYMDDDGYLSVVGRKDDLLKSGGHKVHTKVIEDSLMNSDMLMETVVLGIPDDLLGTKPVALAVPKNGTFSEKQLLAHCNRRLAKYEIPSAVMLVDALPKNAAGKIDRQECLKLLFARGQNQQDMPTLKGRSSS
jgi:long-chain acyl-CoA synthetase